LTPLTTNIGSPLLIPAAAVVAEAPILKSAIIYEE